MNGAQALLQTLADAGVEVCFTNPGTSEMHFVAALDSEPRMRAVLALFEGVATGAADGYARMADKPAATLLHLGCGLGNGLANLHNARKGKVPVVNIVGDHATYHTQYDAQLQSDIETVARNVSPGFVRTAQSTAALCQDAADAIAAARGLPGQVATLILPADVSWGEGAQPCTLPTPSAAPVADDASVQAIAQLLRSGKKTALLLGGQALREPGLLAAARIAAQAGVPLLAEVFPTRLTRGAGLPAVERIAYLAELATLTAPFVEQAGFGALTQERLEPLCAMFRERANTLKALAESFRPLLVPAADLEYAEKDAAKHLTDGGKAHLRALTAIFAACEPFTAENIEAALNAYVADNGLKFKEVAPPLRTALMGFMGGSHLNEIMAFLGREETLARLDRAAG